MTTILVTGGAGYVGSHTCKVLANAGYTPVCYDNLSTGHASSVKWGPLVLGDINDKMALEKVIKTYQPVAAFHFAASAIVTESILNPALYYRNNVLGTLTLIETMCALGLKNLIFSSTCATYGNAKQLPMTEDHPQVPTTPYGKTKWIAEQMMIDFDRSHELKTVKLRYFNAAGADFEGELGEKHNPETHLIPSVIQAALGQKKEIVVYGADFLTPDGSAVRDYIHVDDLAQAHVKALQHLLETKQSHTFNLGCGRGYSVFEIIKAVEKISGQKIEQRIEKKREGEPAMLTADSTKAKNELGWMPQHSFEAIISSAYNWHKTL